MRGEINKLFIIKQIKKPRLCSVVLQSFKSLLRPGCFTIEQSTVKPPFLLNIVIRLYSYNNETWPLSVHTNSLDEILICL